MKGGKPQGWGQARPVFFAGRNILPRAHAPLRTFMVAMTVMCFLAAMAAGGMFMTWRAIDDWKAGVVSEATAQVLPLEDGEKAFKERIGQVMEILRADKGVKAARLLSREENRALLSPWLGDEGLPEDVPLPRLIAVELNRDNPPDIKALDGMLRAKVPGARLDAHGHWVLRLSDMARTASWLGMAILAAIALAAAILVAWAARAALESNRATIEVLHLVGAKDRFIARQVERRFLRAGFVSAVSGVAAAIAALGLMALLAPSEGIREGAWAMLTGEGGDFRVHATWLMIIIMAMLIPLISARTSVMRILRGMFRQG